MTATMTSRHAWFVIAVGLMLLAPFGVAAAQNGTGGGNETGDNDTNTTNGNTTETNQTGYQAIEAKALDDHACEGPDFHFVITQVEDEGHAPSNINVTWSGGAEETVALTGFTGQVAHYNASANGTDAVEAANTSIYLEWDGQFNLSSGPCPQDGDGFDLNETDENETNTSDDNETDDVDGADGAEEEPSFVANGCGQVVVQDNDRGFGQGAGDNASQSSQQNTNQTISQQCTIGGNHVTVNIDEDNRVVQNVQVQNNVQVFSEVNVGGGEDLQATPNGRQLSVTSGEARATFIDSEGVVCTFAATESDPIELVISQEATVQEWVPPGHRKDPAASNIEDTPADERATKFKVSVQETVLLLTGDNIEWDESSRTLVVKDSLACRSAGGGSPIDMAVQEARVHAQVFIDDDSDEDATFHVERVTVEDVQVHTDDEFEATCHVVCECADGPAVIVLTFDRDDLGDAETATLVANLVVEIDGEEVERADSIDVVLETNTTEGPLFFAEDADDDVNVVLQVSQGTDEGDVSVFTTQSAGESTVDGTNDSEDGPTNVTVDPENPNVEVPLGIAPALVALALAVGVGALVRRKQ